MQHFRELGHCWGAPPFIKISKFNWHSDMLLKVNDCISV